MSNWTGRDISLIVLGVLQVVFACVLFVLMVSSLLAAAAYLGVGPAAPAILLFDLWGVISGFWLLLRRSIAACRAAAIWYLLIGLLLLAFAIQNSRAHPAWRFESFSSAFAFLMIFAILAVPLLPGYYPSFWPLPKSSGRDMFLSVLAVLQVGFASYVFVDHVARVLAGKDLGINTQVPFVLLFDLWGAVSGVLLLFRRSVDTCRMAAIWYLPVGLFFFGFSARQPVGQTGNFSLPVVFLLIFVVLAVPLLPGYYPWSGERKV